ncbi:HEAT repeat domain-containing protein [Egbenema bharatensis]|uniref:HEAT repeat domain-containing protein n=1 Tax=Egbenema bharatensis TaxID=3463334 RepID=UPI003A851B32
MLEQSPNSPSPECSPGAEPLTPEQAIANLTHSDLSLRYYAAWWLGKYRVKHPAAVDGLIAALEDESDRTELGGYPLRRNAARALGKLEDQRAVPGLVRCLTCEDFYVREAAAQSLGMLGDPVCIPDLLPLLQGGVDAARPIPGRPHLAQPYEAVMEALGMLAPRTEWTAEAIELIRPFLQHSTERVCYSATRAMYQLTGDSTYGDRLIQALSASDINLRRVALSDLGAVGYLPAAEAIFNAAAENSFKLFSLKGVLERQVEPSDSSLSPDAVRVMELMDKLL